MKILRACGFRVIVTKNRKALTINFRLVAFAFAILAFTFIGIFHLLYKNPIDTNILSLLPAGERDVALERAIRTLTSNTERNYSLLVSTEEMEKAIRLSERVAGLMRESGIFSSVKLHFNTEEFVDLGQFYFPYRYRLNDMGVMDEKLANRLVDQSVAKIFSPFSGVTSQLITKDPFFFFSSFISGLGDQAKGNFSIENGLMVNHTEGRTYVFIQALLNDSPFSLDLQEQVGKLKKQVGVVMDENAEFLTAGLMEHALVSASKARKEASIVAGFSIAGIILLIFLTFRQLLPIATGLFTIYCGLITGLAVTLLLFDSIHIVTLVAGGSLIGISLDYSMHFFGDQFRQGLQWSPSAAINHIRPGITLGLVTSVFSFISLLPAPFPGLRQLAVFSASGLTAAFFSVLLVYPVVTKKMSLPRTPVILPLLRRIAIWWQNVRSQKVYGVLFPLTILVYIGAFFLIQPDDNVKLLQTPDSDVIANEEKLNELTGQMISTQFLLVKGSHPEEVLQKEEELIIKLHELKEQSIIDGWLAISAFIPSEKKQDENLFQAKRLAEGKHSAIYKLGDLVGLTDDVILNFQNDLHRSSGNPLRFEEWYRSPVMQEIKRLWIGETDNGSASVVLLKKITDLQPLNELAENLPHVTLVDTPSDISEILKKYRERAIFLLMFGYIVIASLLMYRYGIMNAVSVLLPPLFTLAFTLLVISLSGEVINLFTLVGLILVLGIGTDYTIFFKEAKTHQVPALLAIFLSMASTILSFGLLAFSHMPAIHSFGLTVFVGIVASFFLSPLAGKPLSSLRKSK